MEYIKIVLTFIVCFLIYLLSPLESNSSLEYELPAKPLQVYNSLTNSYFPRSKIAVGLNKEILKENENVLIEVIESEIPFKFAFEIKNSSRFSEYSYFYAIQENPDGTSHLNVKMKWSPESGLKGKILNRFFYKQENENHLETEREILLSQFK